MAAVLLKWARALAVCLCDDGLGPGSRAGNAGASSSAARAKAGPRLLHAPSLHPPPEPSDAARGGSRPPAVGSSLGDSLGNALGDSLDKGSAMGSGVGLEERLLSATNLDGGEPDMEECLDQYCQGVRQGDARDIAADKATAEELAWGEESSSPSEPGAFGAKVRAEFGVGAASGASSVVSASSSRGEGFSSGRSLHRPRLISDLGTAMRCADPRQTSGASTHAAAPSAVPISPFGITLCNASGIT